jgi:hypothetical protein
MFDFKYKKFVYLSIIVLALGLFSLSLSYKQPKKSEEEVNTYLDSILSSLIFELDASIPDSYAGNGQFWKNLVRVPADGSDPSSYDLMLGKTAKDEEDDPVFFNDKFVFDGEDIFVLRGVKKDQINENTKLLKSLSNNSDLIILKTRRGGLL